MVLFFHSMAICKTDYYPEERTYTSNDSGYAQYGTPSLHQRGIFSLTFDDGPHEIYTPILLNILKSYNVKATFFLVTSRINSRTKPIIRRMIEEGHTIGAHTVHHHNSNDINEKDFRVEIKKSILDIQKALQELNLPQQEIYFRFPYAAYGKTSKYHHLNIMQEISKEIFTENCIQFVFWDIDSSDWVPGITSAEITQNLISNYEGGEFVSYKLKKQVIIKGYTTITNPLKGGIILLHDIHKRTLEGTKNFLEYAKNNGLSFVNVNETVENSVNEQLNCKLN